jgi:hypothetical protein
MASSSFSEEGMYSSTKNLSSLLDTRNFASPQSVSLPLRNSDESRIPLVLMDGTVFRASLDKYGRYLMRLGFMELLSKPKQTFYGEEAVEASRREFDRNVVKAPAVYEYVVRESIPEWLSSSFPPILGTYSCDFGFISERLYGLELVSGDTEFSDHDQDSEGESDQD